MCVRACVCVCVNRLQKIHEIQGSIIRNNSSSTYSCLLSNLQKSDATKLKKSNKTVESCIFHKRVLFLYVPLNTKNKTILYVAQKCFTFVFPTEEERWGAGIETQKYVRGEIGGWGRVPFNETYAPSLSTIYDGA